MRWKRTKLYVTVAGIFGASKWTNLKLASVALTAEWGSRSLSNMAIRSVSLGRVTLTLKLSQSQCMKGFQFSREFGTAVI